MSKAYAKVILLQNIHKRGNFGGTINVKPGYARNFLIPRELAIYANESNKAKFNLMKVVALERANMLREEAMKIGERLKNLNICVIKNSSRDKKIFGSVVPKDIFDFLLKNGVNDVSRNQIFVINQIKYLGMHVVKFVLSSDVILEKKIYVVNSLEDIASFTKNDNEQNPSEPVEETQDNTNSTFADDEEN